MIGNNCKSEFNIVWNKASNKQIDFETELSEVSLYLESVLLFQTV
jgi:hypothetical protein